MKFSFEKATELFDLRDDGHLDLDGSFVSHFASAKTRKTNCGKEVGIYSDGWCWGAPSDIITCETCRRDS